MSGLCRSDPGIKPTRCGPTSRPSGSPEGPGPRRIPSNGPINPQGQDLTFLAGLPDLIFALRSAPEVAVAGLHVARFSRITGV